MIAALIVIQDLRDQGMSHGAIWGKSISGRGTKRSRSLKAGGCLRGRVQEKQGDRCAEQSSGPGARSQAAQSLPGRGRDLIHFSVGCICFVLQ